MHTMGMAFVARWAAAVAVTPVTSSTSTGRRTSSITNSCRRSGFAASIAPYEQKISTLGITELA